MSALLERPELFSGRIESFGYEYLSFETRKLTAGARARRGNRRRTNWPSSYWAVCARWPQRRKAGRVSADAITYSRPALHSVPAGGYRIFRYAPIPIAISRSAIAARKRHHPARLVTPDEVRVEIRGGGNATRQIHHMLTPEFPAHRLLVVEVFTPAGNWSSYPPHKHDVHNPPGEVDLEEIYYYRLDRPEGYAIQKVYTADRRIDETLSVRDGELVLIPEGYHPVVAAHGYNVYYLNALAGSARSMAASDDPDYAWVRGTWREQDPRLPMVKR